MSTTVQEVVSDADNRTFRDVAGFGILLALTVALPHLYLLNSRSGYRALPPASLCIAAVLLLLALVPSLRLLTRRRSFMLACSLASTAAGLCFVAFPHPIVHVVCLCLQAAALAAMTLCWGARLAARDTRSLLLVGSSALVFASLVCLLATGVGESTGLTANLSNHTTVAIAFYAVLSLFSGIAFTAVDGSNATDGHGISADGSNATEGHSISADGKASAKRHGTGAKQASDSSSSRGRRGLAADIPLLTSLITLGAGCLVASFFSGVGFNPYVGDTLAIDALRSVISIVVSAGLFVAATHVEPTHATHVITPFAATILAMCVAGIVLLTLGVPSDQTFPIALTLSSCGLLTVLVFVLACTSQRADTAVTLLGIAFSICGGLWPFAVGIRVKQMVGYSLATITPLVVLAIAFLAILSSLQSVRAGAHAVETRKQLEIADARADKMAGTQFDKLADQHYRAILDEYSLTKREDEVAIRAMKGLSITTIAEELGITDKTVSFHLHNIYRKLGIDSKNDLPLLANRHETGKH